MTIPTLLTLGRIAAVAVVAVLLMVPGEAARWAAFGVFLAATLTDWLDGYLARRLGQGSDLGRMLDPIADKMLVAVVLLMLVAEGTVGGVHVLAVALILAREVFISGLREFLGGAGVVVAVSGLAKWKTTLQLVATAFLVVAPVANLGAFLAWWIGVTLLWFAAFVTVVTGIDYLRGSLPHLGVGRGEAAGAGTAKGGTEG